MKIYLKVVTILLVILTVLVGCGDMMAEESEPLSPQGPPIPSIALSWPESLPPLSDDAIPEEIQQMYERYREVIDQHGRLIAMGKSDFKFFSFTLYPVVEDTSVSSVFVEFERDGTKSLTLQVSGYTESYLKELLTLTLLVIDPGMQFDEAIRVAEDLYASYRKGELNEGMDIGNYSVSFSKRLSIFMPDFFEFKSSKTVYDKYKFDKSEYKKLTYDMVEGLQDFGVFEKHTNKLVYIEGTFIGTSSLDTRKKEVIDEEGNVFLITYDYEKIRFLKEGAKYRLYGTLKISIDELVYLDVQYPYGF